VKSGKTEIETVKRARETLEKIKANIIGVVLNNIDKKAIGNNYYPYYYYGTDEKKKKVKKKKLLVNK
jgi:Mrp family chromosome partitioning ATPase